MIFSIAADVWPDLLSTVRITVEMLGGVALAYIAYKTKVAATKVDQVKMDLEKTNAATTQHLTRQDKAIEQVHQATNGMKDDLVEEVRKASFAAGAKSETDKTDTGG